MPKNTNKIEYADYKSSSLFHLLSEFSQQITQTHKLYEFVFNSSKKTLEESHSVKQFLTIQDMVNQGLSAILIFDKGKIPSDFTFLSTLATIKHLLKFKEKFCTREGEIIELLDSILPEVIISCSNSVKMDLNANFLDLLKNKLKKIDVDIEDRVKNLPGVPSKELMQNYFSVIDKLSDDNFLGDVEAYKRKILEYFRSQLLSGLDTHGLLITHPMMYQLAIDLLAFLQKFPDEGLSALIPFFNPLAISVDYASGFYGGLVGRSLSGGFKFDLLDPIPNQDSDVKSLHYKYNMTVSGHYFPEVDLDKIYKEFKPKLTHQLLIQFAKYFQTYKETLHSQIEFSKVRFCSLFSKNEIAILNKGVEVLFAEVSSVVDSDVHSLNVFDYPERLKVTLQAKEKLYSCLEHINNRLSEYNQLSIKALTQSHVDSFTDYDKIQQESPSSLWLNDKLQDFLVGYPEQSSKIQIIPLKLTLQEALRNVMVILNQKVDIIEHRLVELKTLYTDSVATWKRTQLQKILAEAGLFTAKCASSESSLQAIEEEFHRILFKTEDQTSLQKHQVNIQDLEDCLKRTNQLYSDTNQLAFNLLSCANFPDPGFSEYNHEVFKKELKKQLESSLQIHGAFKEKAHLLQDKIKFHLNEKITRLKRIEEEDTLIKRLSESGLDNLDDCLKGLEQQICIDENELVNVAKGIEGKLKLLKDKNTLMNSYVIRQEELKCEKTKLANERKQIVKQLLQVGQSHSSEMVLSTPKQIHFFIDEKIEAINQSLIKIAGALDSKDYQGQLKAIKETFELLTKSKSILIPLETINKMASLNSINSVYKGFNCLLEFLGESTNISLWSSYLKRQKSASKEEQVNKWSELTNLIQKREQYYVNCMSDRKDSDAVIRSLNDCKIQYQLFDKQVYEQELSEKQIDGDLKIISDELKKFQKQLSDMELEINEARRVISDFEFQKKEKAEHIKCIAKIMVIFQGLNELQSQLKLNSLSTRSQNNSNENHTFLKTVIIFFQKLLAFKQELGTIKDRAHTISGLSHIHYVEQLESYIKIIHQGVETLVQQGLGEYFLNLQNKVEAILESFRGNQAELQTINTMIVGEERMVQLSACKNTFTMLSQQNQMLIEEVGKVLALVHDTECHRLFRELHASYHDLTNFNESTLPKYVSLLALGRGQLLNDILTALTYPKDDSSKLTYQLIMQRCVQIQSLKNYCKDVLSFDSNSMDAIELQLTLVQEQSRGIEARIMRREELVKMFKNQITEYMQRRRNNYYYKDVLFSTDKVERERYLNQLITRLDDYVDSGESTTLLDQLFEERNKFPGVDLKSLLNKLHLELANSEAVVREQLIDDANVAVVLGELENKHSSYYQKLSKLKHSIQDFNQYGLVLQMRDSKIGSVVLGFAKELTTALNQWIMSHGATIPSQESLMKFYRKFSCQLHTLDNQMAEHRASWRPILLNIIIAISTLCIAPLIQLVHSKMTQGTYSFFFFKTQRESLIEDIDSNVQSLYRE